MPLLPSVCDPENPSFYTISLTYTQELVRVTAQGMDGISLPFSAGRGALLLTVGNTPRMFCTLYIGPTTAPFTDILLLYLSAGFAVPENSDLFRFLLSANLPRDSPPPGLFGCVNNVTLGGDPFSLQDAISMENLLIGFCPS